MDFQILETFLRLQKSTYLVSIHWYAQKALQLIYQHRLVISKKKTNKNIETESWGKNVCIKFLPIGTIKGTIEIYINH